MIDVLLWCFTAAMASVGSLCRIMVLLYGKDAPEPPLKLDKYGHWVRRRRWLVMSETSAVPAITACSILTYKEHAPEIALGIGLSGSVLFISAIQARLRRILGIPDDD